MEVGFPAFHVRDCGGGRHVHACETVKEVDGLKCAPQEAYAMVARVVIEWEGNAGGAAPY